MEPRVEVERYFELDERIGRARTTAEERPLLERRREAVVDALEAYFRADADATLDRLEREGRVEVGEESMTFGEAKAALPRETARPRRASVERGIGRFLSGHVDPFARRIDAAHAAASALGGAALALREKVTGISPSALEGPAAQLLRETEDPYRDVLGYAFGRIAPALRPLPHGEGRRHDLEHLATAPWLRRHFGSGAQAARYWLSAWDVPFPATPTGERDSGLDGHHAALAEAGRLLRRSAFSAALRGEDRLEDPVVSEACALLGSHLLCEERWLTLELRCSRAEARELARIAALVRLGALRRDCARLPLAPLPYERGLGAQARDAWREGLTHALFVEHHPFWPLLDLEPPHQVARALMAWALEAALVPHLRERFDDDWFRNPATGKALSALLEAPTSADALGARVGKPSLEEAGKRLVRVLAA